MYIAKRYGDEELATLLALVVLYVNGTMMQLDERARQVETNARSKVPFVHADRCLIETLEYLVQFLGWNTGTTVAYSDGDLIGIVGQTHRDLSTDRRKLEGVGEEIDNNLVEVVIVFGHAVGGIVTESVEFQIDFVRRADVAD